MLQIWLLKNLNLVSHVKQILELHSYTEVKYSNWLNLVLWLAKALFQHSIAMLL